MNTGTIPHAHFFIILGRSGAGKGTQSKLLKESLEKIESSKKVLYVQSGEEIRTFIHGKGFTEKLAEDIYNTGALQPEFLAVHLWSKVLIEKYNGIDHIIFDGAPRKRHETGVLESAISFYKLEKPFVINLTISNQESIKRLLSRQRMDDNEEEIRKRLAWYETDVLPTLEYYRTSENYRYLEINGERTIEEIHKDILMKTGLDLITS